MKKKGSIDNVGKIVLSEDISDIDRIKSISLIKDLFTITGRVRIDGLKEGDITLIPFVIAKINENLSGMVKKSFEKHSKEYPFFAIMGFLLSKALGNAYLLLVQMKNNPSQKMAVIYFKELNISIYSLHNEGDKDMEDMKNSMGGSHSTKTVLQVVYIII